MRRTISVKSKTTLGKEKTKTLTYINPDATKAQMQTTISKYNALSSNTYEDASVIETRSITETQQTEPNLSIGEWTTTGENQYSTPITYNGDGNLVVTNNNFSVDGTTLKANGNGQTTYLFATGTTNYYAKDISVTSPAS